MCTNDPKIYMVAILSRREHLAGRGPQPRFLSCSTLWSGVESALGERPQGRLSTPGQDTTASRHPPSGMLRCLFPDSRPCLAAFLFYRGSHERPTNRFTVLRHGRGGQAGRQSTGSHLEACSLGQVALRPYPGRKDCLRSARRPSHQEQRRTRQAAAQATTRRSVTCNKPCPYPPVTLQHLARSAGRMRGHSHGSTGASGIGAPVDSRLI